VNERYPRFLVALLALVGAGIAGYLTYTHYNGSPPVCGLGVHGCETVQNSSYSKLFGIPVALLGLLTYLSIFCSTLIRHPLVRQAGVMVALVAVGFNAYLFYLQAEKIHAYCIWCISNEIVSVFLAATAITWLFSRAKDTAT
jgi:uncharacterized membrane protein